MALFNRQKSTTPPFDKEEVLNEIIDAIESKYPDYAIIAKDDAENPWDILVIRTVPRETKYTLGAFGHERVKQERLQQVFPITVTAFPTQIDTESLLEVTGAWVTTHLVVNNVEAVMRRLQQE